MSDYFNLTAFDRKRKRQPNNTHAKNAKELIVDPSCCHIDYTSTGNDNVPFKVSEEWYRKTDSGGNLYFFSPKDSKLLAEAIDCFGDGTFAPISGKGVKCHFVQLYILSVRLELQKDAVLSFPCVFVFMTSFSSLNYDLVFKTLKSIIYKDVGFEFSPCNFYIDFEKSSMKALKDNFPNAHIVNCYFYCLQTWRRKFLQLGFKEKIEVRSENFSPKFVEFWSFLSGLPNMNLHLSCFRDQIKIELDYYKNNLPFDSTAQKEAFDKYLRYLDKYYFSENATFPFKNWEQFTNITSNPDNFSRTTNVSESVHSSLNKNYIYKRNFNASIKKLHLFKESYVRSLAAYSPSNYFNSNVKPSNKRSVRPSDRNRLNKLASIIRSFGQLPLSEQILNFRAHAIECGSLRRCAYEKNKIWSSETLNSDIVSDEE